MLRRTLQLVSWLALAGSLAPSCLFLAGAMDLDGVKAAMFASTAAWFAATPFWMERKTDAA